MLRIEYKIANAITQDASKTAGGVRTISLRLAGTEEAKDELASLGEDVDDFVVQTNSKTQQIIKDYTAVASNAYQGVDVLDANGNLRNTYDILLDIAKVYKEIQEEDKKAGTNRANALVEAIAGKNRSNIASSILLNPEMLESVYNSALDADGAAMKELDSYMESLDAKVAQFQNRLQELESDLVSSDFLKGIVDFGTGAIHVLDQLIDKFGVLPTLATAIAAALSFKNIGIFKTNKNGITIGGKTVDEISEDFDKLSNYISEKASKISSDLSAVQDKINSKNTPSTWSYDELPNSNISNLNKENYSIADKIREQNEYNELLKNENSSIEAAIE